MVKATRFYKLISALLAFLLWGSWGYYINSEASHDAGALSGIIQGSASFLITLIMVYMVEYFYRLFKETKLQIIASSVITVSITTIFLVSAHYFAETPHILFTVSPAITVAFIFCLYTAYKLHQITLNNNYG